MSISLGDYAGSADYVSVPPAQLYYPQVGTAAPVPQYMLPVVMIALQALFQSAITGRLPNISPGGKFWAKYNDMVALLAGGMAVVAPPGTVPPAPEPPYTANQTAGVAAGTSNSSH